MKRLILLVFSASLLFACKGKNDNKEKNDRPKDDYSKTTKTEDKDSKKEEGNESGENETVSNWPQNEKDGFMSSCKNSAMTKGGQSAEVAESYCRCMMEKMEKKYPDINKLIQLSEEDVNAFTNANKEDCIGKQ